MTRSRIGIAIAIASGIGVTSAAQAVAGPLVTPPSGWTGGANAELAKQTTAQPHFDGAKTTIEAERYDAPTPGVVLFVVRASATTTNPASAAGAELASLRDHGPNVEVVETDQRVDDANREVDATVTWRDRSTKTSDAARMLVAATSQSITAITGECLAASDAAQPLIDTCSAALVTLQLGVPVAQRIALVPAEPHAGGSTLPATPPVGASTTTPASASTMAPAPPSAATRPALPPIAVAQEDPPADKRPLIIGAGLVVLAAVFWWNRKRRARFAAEASDDAKGPR
jgi:hypothetical protein